MNYTIYEVHDPSKRYVVLSNNHRLGDYKERLSNGFSCNTKRGLYPKNVACSFYSLY
jgi:hypothetical protein